MCIQALLHTRIYRSVREGVARGTCHQNVFDMTREYVLIVVAADVASRTARKQQQETNEWAPPSELFMDAINMISCTICSVQKALYDIKNESSRSVYPLATGGSCWTSLTLCPILEL